MVVTNKNPRKQVYAEANSGETIVDASTYVEPSKRIKQMMLAGENLLDQRRLYYHTDRYGKLVNDPNWQDPLAYRGLDPVEIADYHTAIIADILKDHPDWKARTKTGNSGPGQESAEQTTEPSSPQTE